MTNLSIRSIRFGLNLCALGILYAFLPFAGFIQITFSGNVNTIDQRKSKIVKKKDWRLMAIKNTVSFEFLSPFIDCEEFFDCHLTGVRDTIRVPKSLDPDQARHFVGPDLGPNCLQRLSAGNTSRQRVNESGLYFHQQSHVHVIVEST